MKAGSKDTLTSESKDRESTCKGWYWENEPNLLKKIKIQKKLFERIVN